MAAVLGGLVDTHAAAASVAALAAADRIDPAQTVVPVLAALSANAASKAVYAVISGGPLRGPGDSRAVADDRRRLGGYAAV